MCLRDFWNSHPQEDFLSHISQYSFFHCCVVCLHSVRFLWLAGIVYLDLSKKPSNLYIIFYPMFVSPLFSEYKLHLINCRCAIYLLPLERLQENGIKVYHPFSPRS